MIDINLLRKDPQQVKDGISKKGTDPKLVDNFLALDKEWREFTKEADNLRARQNELSSQRNIEEGKKVKIQVQKIETTLKKLEASRQEILEQIPNLPATDVPQGVDESSNVVMKKIGEPTKFDFEPKDYLTLAGDLIDTERAAKVSGSRFGYVFGDIVLLEIAVV